MKYKLSKEEQTDKRNSNSSNSTVGLLILFETKFKRCNLSLKLHLNQN